MIGLHVVDIVSIEGSFFHDISGSLGFEPYLDFSSKMRGVLQERGKALLEAFAEEARAAQRACATPCSAWASSPTRSSSAPGPPIWW